MTEGEILSRTWEKLRNESWQKQEIFIAFLISQLASAQATLEFLAADKYIGRQMGKHIEKNAHELVDEYFKEYTELFEKLAISIDESEE